MNAIFSAKDVVEHEQSGQVPVYLRDAHYGGAKKLGHTGYKYSLPVIPRINAQTTSPKITWIIRKAAIRFIISIKVLPLSS